MIQNPDIRVRFAPSPTGSLHLGGARTALFNWLYARKTGGTFVLRIEDTDARRSTEESYRGILEGMGWLGLNWDEGPDVDGPCGPYLQSARTVLYHEHLKRLVAEGHAYPCFCSAETLEEMREKARAEKRPPRYDGRCRGLTPEEREERIAGGEPHVFRLRMPEGETISFRDLSRGQLQFESSELDDFVIMKSDGRPTYNFAVVVDDAKMRISHVIRGDDHLSNTPRQVAVYRAFDYRLPKFLHLPLVTGMDKVRLSKRHGASSVTEFRERGYLPDAMVNYLALLGWSLDGKTELFTRKKLVESFSLKRVGKTPSAFDMEKLNWINARHFQSLPTGRKAALVFQEMKRTGLWPADFRMKLGREVEFKVIRGAKEEAESARTIVVGNGSSTENGSDSDHGFVDELPRLIMILQMLGNRLKGVSGVPEQMGYFYKDRFEVDDRAVATHLHSKEVGRNLEGLAGRLLEVESFEPEKIEEAVRSYADELDVPAGEIIHPSRVALTGRAVSPGIFQVMYLLGKEKVVERLRKGAAVASGSEQSLVG
jgi:nondiscriminating glutamyl-tRNA synthetase